MIVTSSLIVGERGAGATPTPVTPGGTSGQVQFNNAGSFGGITGATSDGTNLSVTTASPLANSLVAASTAYADSNLIGPALVSWREDFTNVVGITASTTTAALLCETVWSCRSIVASGNIQGNGGATFANPGVLQLQTGATSGNGNSILKAFGASSNLGNLGSNAGWQLNFIFKLASTSTICVRMGLTSTNENNVDPPTDGFWAEYDTANANSNTSFTWRTSVSSTTAYSTTNSKVADTSFHHIRIRSTVAGTIGFTIDGGTEFTTTTDVSTIGMMVFFQVITRANSAAELDLDFVSYAAATGRT